MARLFYGVRSSHQQTGTSRRHGSLALCRKQVLQNPAQLPRLSIRGFARLNNQPLIFGWPAPGEDEPPVTRGLSIDGVEMRSRFRDHNKAVLDNHSKLEFAHGLSPASTGRPAPPKE